MKKIIYTQRVEIIDAYKERRDSADQRIAEYVLAAGYIPIPVPNINMDYDLFVDSINPSGIILTGGNSLVEYGGDAPERDITDKKLIEIAIKRNIPLLGICRGMQSILVYFGNKLNNVNNHVKVSHLISGLKPSREVNSFHNQACAKLINEELEVIMKASDGVIEEIKHKKHPIEAIMWHPEREMPFSNTELERLKKLFG